MPRTTTFVLTLVVSATACNRAPDEQVQTPLPTRQTTIEPVKKKLDAAADDMQRRRQDIDAAAK